MKIIFSKNGLAMSWGKNATFEKDGEKNFPLSLSFFYVFPLRCTDERKKERTCSSGSDINNSINSRNGSNNNSNGNNSSSSNTSSYNCGNSNGNSNGSNISSNSATTTTTATATTTTTSAAGKGVKPALIHFLIEIFNRNPSLDLFVCLLLS